MQEHQQGNVEGNSSEIPRPGKSGNSYFNPARPAEENEAAFGSEDQSNEINPAKLDNEEADVDGAGADDSKGHEPYEFKTDGEGSRSIRKGYDESNFSVDSSAQRSGETTDESRGESVKKSEAGILIGQGGYGSSGTSGTNSGGSQGYQSGLGSAGLLNGSTGYNAGSMGMPQIQPERPNKEVNINELGKRIRDDETMTRH